MNTWPLVLAGPIVRRIEPHMASVWVALKEPRSVRLSIWSAPIDTGSGDDLFAGEPPRVAGTAQTLRVGEHLHIAVVTATSDDPLLPGQIYAYNLSFGPHGTIDAAPTEDLKSLKLLQDHQPGTPGFVLGHLALGYVPNLLPAFVTAPAELTDLRIVHGSCRRPHADVPDLLAGLDDLIATARLEALERPHQLFLTGDQIYADDVATALLHLTTRVGNQLLGSVEQLPVNWTAGGDQPGVKLWPADHTHFPAGARKAVIMEDARFTTVDGTSQLLSFAEFCAMHLLCWSNTLWPEDLPAYEQVFWGEPLPPLQFDEVLAGIALPPAIWQLHTGLHEGGAYGLKQLFEETRDQQHFVAIHVGALLTRIATGHKAEDDERAQQLFDAYRRQTKVVETFRGGLAHVRRALANVSTYMIFDDHEVTDDWNLSAIWRDRVFTSSLGKTVLRNGMLAYALCQGWGNDPLGFMEDTTEPGEDRAPGPRKRLLAAIARLFPAGGTLSPEPTAAEEIDLLLGLDGSDPPVRWHYRVDGPRHRVLVLDTRTRRSFATRIAPPSNLSLNALRDQVPEAPLPAGIEVLVVISPLPLLGLPLIDELGGALAVNAYDVTHYRAIGGMPGTNPDAAEGWAFAPETLEATLARLAPYRRIVVLSGDVHYGYSAEASYWIRGDERPARFAQFTSSGFKNQWPDPALVLFRSFAFGQTLQQLYSPVVRLGWDQHEPQPVRLPPDFTPVGAVRAALLRSPLLLTPHGWPEGAEIERAPDWAWRLSLCRDPRPINQVPSAARPAPLDPQHPDADASPTVEGYRRTARRHAQQLDKVTHTRQVLFASNAGLVTFARDNGVLVARHDLSSRPPGAGAVAAYTRHTVALDAEPESMPAIGGET